MTTFSFFSCLRCVVLFTHYSSCKQPMAENDHEQWRDLRLEATELFVRQQLSANLGPAASRRRGNLFRQQLANERYTNDMTFRVLNKLSGQERADFIHFAESKLEPLSEPRIFAPVISSGATSSTTAAATSSATDATSSANAKDTTHPPQERIKSSSLKRSPTPSPPTSPIEEFSPEDHAQDLPTHTEDDPIQDLSQDPVLTMDKGRDLVEG